MSDKEGNTHEEMQATNEPVAPEEPPVESSEPVAAAEKPVTPKEKAAEEKKTSPVKSDNHEPTADEEGEEEGEPKGAAVSKVRVLTDEDISVGGRIQLKMEAIFARASSGMPMYEELGGIEGIAKEMGIDLATGIDVATVEQRRATFGVNKLPDEDPVTFLEILLNACADHMIIILTIAAIISLILGLTVAPHGEDEVDYSKGWIEGVAILISVTLVTTISSVNDYRKEQKFRKLTQENSLQDIQVFRNGELEIVDITEVVVGDLVSINPGLQMPVDGFYVRGLSVVIDESAVTGENDPKKKNAENPFVLTSTVVNTAENCLILVGAVGVNSFGGKLIMEARGDGGIRPTPLQDRLDDMADNIGKFGMAIAILLFVVLSIIEAVRFGRDDPAADGRRFLDYFIIAVAIIVVAVPEGLPLAVTISLAYSQNKMRKDNNQVRRLKACETMGNATTICSDKTGTLTQNLMSVVQGYVCGKYFRVKRPGEQLEKIVLDGFDAETTDILTYGLAINSSSVKTIHTHDREGKPITPKWVWDLDKGNKTDNALLDLVDRVLLEESDVAELKSLPHRRIRESLVDGSYNVFPFTSSRKRMSTAVKKDGKVILYVKGGADQILPCCEFYRDAEGKKQVLDEKTQKFLEEKIRGFAQSANRNIGLAYCELEGDTIPEEEPEGGYVWAGVVGIQDPLRPEVIDAVEKCQHAGVTVRMCTGDNIDTAMAISRQCGIFSHGDIAMTGQEFRNMVYDAAAVPDGDAILTPILQRMTVLARSQPLDKQLLVLMHMVRGEIVAVTGDGTNDAPALKLANVGFVMRSGTDIAVKSADIVLLDDNFRSVQRAVVWGRTVNDNIRKFLQLQLTVNVVSVLLTFIGSVSSSTSESPLTTVQLLWINLIMDTFAALALATEEPSEACLKRGPVPKSAPLVTRRMWVFILSQSAYQLTMTLVLQHKGADLFDVADGSLEHKTIVFNAFVWATIFNMFNARKLYREWNIFEGFNRSVFFLFIITLTIGIQIMAVELFKDFMQTRPLDWDHWIGCVVCGIVAWPVALIQKLVPVPEAKVVREFDIEDIDEDAKKMFDRLQEDIETAVEARTEAEMANAGQSLAAARKMQSQALWRKVAVHHYHHPRILGALRRAHTDKDLKTEEAKGDYHHFKTHH